MRVLLRHGEAGPYHAGAAGWLADRARALDFTLIEEAIRQNCTQSLGATHVVLAYDNPFCNLTLPINDGLMTTRPSSS